MRAAVLALLALLTACPHHGRAPRPPRPPRPPVTTTQTTTPPRPDAPHLSWSRAPTADLVPHDPPPAGTYRVHLIDVGTGLAILVQGADFTMLFDAGTNDRDEKPARVAAYLAAALGPSGDELCGPNPTYQGPPVPGVEPPRRSIDHVFLSHPHFDHGSALDLVVHCYAVHFFWDAGRIVETVFYRELLAAVARSSVTTYRTAASPSYDHALALKGFAVTLPRWERFSEGDVVPLGAGARFTVLHAEAKSVPDPNANSIVLLVELGKARLLLLGDAPSGERMDPSYPPGEVEEFLLDHHRAEVRADILQVAHHGSKTSSRKQFLDAVAPTLALVSSGPKRYGHTVLPDAEVIEALHATGATVLRTDEHDDACPERNRIGGDHGPGGCDSWVITIAP